MPPREKTVIPANPSIASWPLSKGDHKRRRLDGGDCKQSGVSASRDQHLPVLLYENPNAGKAKGRGRGGNKSGAPPLKGSCEPPTAGLGDSRPVRCFAAVEQFLAAAGVECERVRVTNTFMHLEYNRRSLSQNIRSEKGKCDDSSVSELQKAIESELHVRVDSHSVWDEYMAANGFVGKCQLVQSLLFKVSGRLVFICVLYPHKVDLGKLAEIVGAPIEQIKMCKLREVQKITHFPLFVCLPFGLPCSTVEQTSEILVESCLQELSPDTDLIFDCGTVALKMKAQEFLRVVKSQTVNVCKGAMPNSSGRGSMEGPPA